MNTPSSYEQDTNTLDSKEFDRLYRQYHRLAYWAAISKGIPESERDDFVQDMFLLIREKYHMLKEKKYESTWIASLIRNRASNYVRDTKKYKHAELIDNLDSPYESDTTPYNDLYVSSTIPYNHPYTSDATLFGNIYTPEKIKHLFEQVLTPEEKDLCIKIIIEGRRITDIFNHSDRSLSFSTFKMRYRRAMLKLKKHYSTKDQLIHALLS